MSGKIIHLESVDSTNTYLKKMTSEGAEDGTVVVAKRQTAGRGRSGNSFVSEDGGLYCSMLIRTAELNLAETTTLTTKVSVAVARALEEICEVYAGIKWVNDLILNGKKIAGNNAREMFSGVTAYIIPMVNPDGVDLVTGELSGGSFYNGAVSISDDYPAIAFPLGWKANISGTDTNLQYPAGWETAREIKFRQGYISPAPRDYTGTAPLTAPESRAVYDFTKKHDFLLTISYHTQGGVIYWKYLDRIPPCSQTLAQKFGALSGYSVEDVPYASGYAGYKDWFIDEYDRPGFTIEVGEGASPVPISQFSDIYSRNIGIFAEGIAFPLNVNC